MSVSDLPVWARTFIFDLLVGFGAAVVALNAAGFFTNLDLADWRAAFLVLATGLAKAFLGVAVRVAVAHGGDFAAVLRGWLGLAK